MEISLDTVKILAPLWNGFFAVLDSRRIVRYVNPSFFADISEPPNPEPDNRRVEEYFGCTDNSSESVTSECGTREGCSFCAVYTAVNESFRNGGTGDFEKIVKETTFISRRNGVFKSYELRITAYPVRMEDNLYSVLIIEDISDLKRRQLMEKVFFHDILNTISSLTMNITLIGASDTLEECHNYTLNLEKIADGLTDEIRKQRIISLAETGRLNVERSIINLKEFIDDIIDSFAGSPELKEKKIITAGENTVFISDKILLRRIVINMIKNALEAAVKDSVVTVAYQREESGVKISVHNEGVIPAEVQARIFHQFYSTKGPKRGLGTYSIRLLTENYLKGSVSFISDKENGTLFSVFVPDLKKPQQ